MPKLRVNISLEYNGSLNEEDFREAMFGLFAVHIPLIEVLAITVMPELTKADIHDPEEAADEARALVAEQKAEDPRYSE